MYYTVIKHEGNVEDMSCGGVFSTFLEFSQMLGVFYHCVIHDLGLFYLLYDIEVMWSPSYIVTFFKKKNPILSVFFLYLSTSQLKYK